MIRIESASDGTLRLDQLPELDERTLLILQAGNVNTGAFDKFEFICELANSRNAWINTDVSNYLFDAYREYPYWIGTREVVEDGIRYVYEKSWLDKGNQSGIVTFTKSIYEGDIIEKTVIEIIGDKMNCLRGKLREEHHSKYNY